MMYSLVDVVHGMHDISNSSFRIKYDGVNRNVPIHFEIMVFLNVRTPQKQSMVTITNKKLGHLETLQAWSCMENCVEVVVGLILQWTPCLSLVISHHHCLSLLISNGNIKYV